jgi:RNA polymerase sigma-70 factor (ECF subfamily)
MNETDRPLYDAFERFRDYLMMVARGMIGVSYRGKIDAEELVNQSLFKAFQQLEQFRGTSEAEQIAWLRQILANIVNGAIRHLHRDKRDIDREQRLAVADWDQSCSDFLGITCGLTSPSVKAVKHEQELALAGALARLPEQQRSAVELRHLQGCSMQETADALETSVAAVAGLLRRGLKRLRELLQTQTESR